MLQIKPLKFYAKHVELGDLEELDLALSDQDLSLSLDAVKSKISDRTVIINLHLSLILNKDDSIGLRLHYCFEFEVADPGNSDFKVTDDTIGDTFIQVNAPAIAYPYVRSFVSMLCVTSGYQPTILPPVNFQAIFNKRKTDKAVSGPQN